MDSHRLRVVNFDAYESGERVEKKYNAKLEKLKHEVYMASSSDKDDTNETGNDFESIDDNKSQLQMAKKICFGDMKMPLGISRKNVDGVRSPATTHKRLEDKIGLPGTSKKHGENITSSSETPKKLSFIKRKSKSEIFRMKSKNKSRKRELKNNTSAVDFTHQFQNSENVPQRKRKVNLFSRKSRKDQKIEDLKKSNEKVNVLFMRETPDFVKYCRNRAESERNKTRKRREIRDNPKIQNDVFGFQKNRNFDPSIYPMSCNYMNIDKLPFKKFRKGKRKPLHPATPINCICKHHAMRVLNSGGDYKTPSIYYNLNTHSPKRRRSYRKRDRELEDVLQTERSYYGVKDEMVEVSSSLLRPVIRCFCDARIGPSRAHLPTRPYRDVTGTRPAHQPPRGRSSYRPCPRKSVPCPCPRSPLPSLPRRNYITAAECKRRVVSSKLRQKMERKKKKAADQSNKRFTGKNCVKYVFFGLLIVVWSPCLLAVILARVIMCPVRVTNFVKTDDTSKRPISVMDSFMKRFRNHEPECEYQRMCFDNCLPECNAGFMTSMANWYTRVVGTVVNSFNAMTSMIKINRNKPPTCGRSSCVSSTHPNPRKNTLFYADNRRWVMKPSRLRRNNTQSFGSSRVEQSMRCEYTPKYWQKSSRNEKCQTKIKSLRKKLSFLSCPVHGSRFAPSRSPRYPSSPAGDGYPMPRNIDQHCICWDKYLSRSGNRILRNNFYGSSAVMPVTTRRLQRQKVNIPPIYYYSTAGIAPSPTNQTFTANTVNLNVKNIADNWPQKDFAKNHLIQRKNGTFPFGAMFDCPCGTKHPLITNLAALKSHKIGLAGKTLNISTKCTPSIILKGLQGQLAKCLTKHDTRNKGNKSLGTHKITGFTDITNTSSSNSHGLPRQCTKCELALNCPFSRGHKQVIKNKRIHTVAKTRRYRSKWAFANLSQSALTKQANTSTSKINFTHKIQNTSRHSLNRKYTTHKIQNTSRHSLNRKYTTHTKTRPLSCSSGSKHKVPKKGYKYDKICVPSQKGPTNITNNNMSDLALNCPCGAKHQSSVRPTKCQKNLNDKTNIISDIALNCSCGDKNKSLKHASIMKSGNNLIRTKKQQSPASIDTNMNSDIALNCPCGNKYTSYKPASTMNSAENLAPSPASIEISITSDIALNCPCGTKDEPIHVSTMDSNHLISVIKQPSPARIKTNIKSDIALNCPCGPKHNIFKHASTMDSRHKLIPTKKQPKPVRNKTSIKSIIALNCPCRTKRRLVRHSSTMDSGENLSLAKRQEKPSTIKSDIALNCPCGAKHMPSKQASTMDSGIHLIPIKKQSSPVCNKKDTKADIALNCPCGAKGRPVKHIATTCSGENVSPVKRQEKPSTIKSDIALTCPCGAKYMPSKQASTMDSGIHLIPIKKQSSPVCNKKDTKADIALNCPCGAKGRLFKHISTMCSGENLSPAKRQEKPIDIALNCPCGAKYMSSKHASTMDSGNNLIPIKKKPSSVCNKKYTKSDIALNCSCGAKHGPVKHVSTMDSGETLSLGKRQEKPSTIKSDIALNCPCGAKYKSLKHVSTMDSGNNLMPYKRHSSPVTIGTNTIAGIALNMNANEHVVTIQRQKSPQARIQTCKQLSTVDFSTTTKHNIALNNPCEIKPSTVDKETLHSQAQPSTAEKGTICSKELTPSFSKIQKTAVQKQSTIDNYQSACQPETEIRKEKSLLKQIGSSKNKDSKQNASLCPHVDSLLIKVAQCTEPKMGECPDAITNCSDIKKQSEVMKQLNSSQGQSLKANLTNKNTQQESDTEIVIAHASKIISHKTAFAKHSNLFARKSNYTSQDILVNSTKNFKCQVFPLVKEACTACSSSSQKPFPIHQSKNLSTVRLSTRVDKDTSCKASLFHKSSDPISQQVNKPLFTTGKTQTGKLLKQISRQQINRPFVDTASSCTSGLIDKQSISSDEIKHLAADIRNTYTRQMSSVKEPPHIKQSHAETFQDQTKFGNSNRLFSSTTPIVAERKSNYAQAPTLSTQSTKLRSQTMGVASNYDYKAQEPNLTKTKKYKPVDQLSTKMTQVRESQSGRTFDESPPRREMGTQPYIFPNLSAPSRETRHHTGCSCLVDTRPTKKESLVVEGVNSLSPLDENSSSNRIKFSKELSTSMTQSDRTSDESPPGEETGTRPNIFPNIGEPSQGTMHHTGCTCSIDNRHTKKKSLVMASVNSQSYLEGNSPRNRLKFSNVPSTSMTQSGRTFDESRPTEETGARPNILPNLIEPSLGTMHHTGCTCLIDNRHTKKKSLVMASVNSQSPLEGNSRSNRLKFSNVPSISTAKSGRTFYESPSHRETRTRPNIFSNLVLPPREIMHHTGCTCSVDNRQTKKESLVMANVNSKSPLKGNSRSNRLKFSNVPSTNTAKSGRTFDESSLRETGTRPYIFSNFIPSREIMHHTGCKCSDVNQQNKKESPVMATVKSQSPIKKESPSNRIKFSKELSTSMTQSGRTLDDSPPRRETGTQPNIFPNLIVPSRETLHHTGCTCSVDNRQTKNSGQSSKNSPFRKKIRLTLLGYNKKDRPQGSKRQLNVPTTKNSEPVEQSTAKVIQVRETDFSQKYGAVESGKQSQVVVSVNSEYPSEENLPSNRLKNSKVLSTSAAISGRTLFESPPRRESGTRPDIFSNLVVPTRENMHHMDCTCSGNNRQTKISRQSSIKSFFRDKARGTLLGNNKNDRPEGSRGPLNISYDHAHSSQNNNAVSYYKTNESNIAIDQKPKRKSSTLSCFQKYILRDKTPIPLLEYPKNHRPQELNHQPCWYTVGSVGQPSCQLQSSKISRYSRRVSSLVKSLFSKLHSGKLSQQTKILKNKPVNSPCLVVVPSCQVKSEHVIESHEIDLPYHIEQQSRITQGSNFSCLNHSACPCSIYAIRSSDKTSIYTSKSEDQSLQYLSSSIYSSAMLDHSGCCCRDHERFPKQFKIKSVNRCKPITLDRSRSRLSTRNIGPLSKSSHRSSLRSLAKSRYHIQNTSSLKYKNNSCYNSPQFPCHRCLLATKQRNICKQPKSSEHLSNVMLPETKKGKCKCVGTHHSFITDSNRKLKPNPEHVTGQPHKITQNKDTLVVEKKQTIVPQYRSPENVAEGPYHCCTQDTPKVNLINPPSTQNFLNKTIVTQAKTTLQQPKYEQPKLCEPNVGTRHLNAKHITPRAPYPPDASHPIIPIIPDMCRCAATQKGNAEYFGKTGLNSVLKPDAPLKDVPSHQVNLGLNNIPRNQGTMCQYPLTKESQISFRTRQHTICNCQQPSGQETLMTQYPSPLKNYQSTPMENQAVPSQHHLSRETLTSKRKSFVNRSPSKLLIEKLRFITNKISTHSNLKLMQERISSINIQTAATIPDKCGCLSQKLQVSEKMLRPSANIADDLPPSEPHLINSRPTKTSEHVVGSPFPDKLNIVNKTPSKVKQNHPNQSHITPNFQSTLNGKHKPSTSDFQTLQGTIKPRFTKVDSLHQYTQPKKTIVKADTLSDTTRQTEFEQEVQLLQLQQYPNTEHVTRQPTYSPSASHPMIPIIPGDGTSTGKLPPNTGYSKNTTVNNDLCPGYTYDPQTPTESNQRETKKKTDGKSQFPQHRLNQPLETSLHAPEKHRYSQKVTRIEAQGKFPHHSSNRQSNIYSRPLNSPPSSKVLQKHLVPNSLPPMIGNKTHSVNPEHPLHYQETSTESEKYTGIKDRSNVQKRYSKKKKRSQTSRTPHPPHSTYIKKPDLNSSVYSSTKKSRYARLKLPNYLNNVGHPNNFLGTQRIIIQRSEISKKILKNQSTKKKLTLKTPKLPECSENLTLETTCGFINHPCYCPPENVSYHRRYIVGGYPDNVPNTPLKSAPVDKPPPGLLQQNSTERTDSAEAKSQKAYPDFNRVSMRYPGHDPADKKPGQSPPPANNYPLARGATPPLNYARDPCYNNPASTCGPKTAFDENALRRAYKRRPLCVPLERPLPKAKKSKKKKRSKKEKKRDKEEKKRSKKEKDHDKEEKKRSKKEKKHDKEKKKKAAPVSSRKKIVDLYYCVRDMVNKSDKEAWPNDVSCSPMWIKALKHKPCFWIYEWWPNLYPTFLSCYKFQQNLCQMMMYLTATCFWCPLFLCGYVCCGVICSGGK